MPGYTFIFIRTTENPHKNLSSYIYQNKLVGLNCTLQEMMFLLRRGGTFLPNIYKNQKVSRLKLFKNCLDSIFIATFYRIKENWVLKFFHVCLAKMIWHPIILQLMVLMLMLSKCVFKKLFQKLFVFVEAIAATRA